MITLQEIQEKLASFHADAYLVTRNNMFLGQDVLPEENKILALTGFSGSAGNLIIFKDKALLLVDGRYDIQARQQTNPDEIEVFCTRDSLGTFIQNNITGHLRFVYDPWCHSVSEVDFWKRALDDHDFVEDKTSLLGKRSIDKKAEIFELEEKFSGIATDEKISYLTDFCHKNKLDGYLLTESDSVSWLMNLRSDLVKNTPILRAFAFVSASGDVSLYTNDFSTLEKELSAFSGKNIGVSFNRTPKKLQNLMKEQHIWVRNVSNPVVDWKDVKNPVEIEGFKQAHLRDGVALVSFLYWLENNWQQTDELGIVKKLHEFRAEQQYFYDESFATIAACGEHGAIIHYQPTEESNHDLKANSVLLLDSGAQYFDGTTDVTRTIAFGIPSKEIIASYTQVLKAHIAAASAMFPLQTPGMMIDALPRSVLWRYGKDYAHGTGHGVGHFLSVHEGPQSLSLKNAVPLKAGMVVSIEPGFYKEDSYGIRLENLALIVETTTDFMSPMLKFEPLTLVPFDKRLIQKELLEPHELAWLNDYHSKVYEKLSPFVEGNLKTWLKDMTRKI